MPSGMKRTIPMRQRRPRVADRDDPQRAVPEAKVHSVTELTRRMLLIRAAAVLLPLVFLAGVMHMLFSRVRPLPPPDDEALVSAYRLRSAGVRASTGDYANVATCMPTVARANGSVEYVSNAVKSWYIAHGGAPPALHVFVMDGSDSSGWMSAVGKVGPWLSVSRLDGSAPPANAEEMRDTKVRHSERRQTESDGERRVAWRSKEARDYAAVLRACASHVVDADGLVLVLQDDVLFRFAMRDASRWAERVLEEDGYVHLGRTRRTCSAALFDVGHGTHDAPLTSSNLVARFWRVRDVPKVASYIEVNYDDAPVDWLADRWCRKQRRAVVPVLRPNPLRHRGRVSSFSENKRDELLT